MVFRLGACGAVSAGCAGQRRQLNPVHRIVEGDQKLGEDIETDHAVSVVVRAAAVNHCDGTVLKLETADLDGIDVGDVGGFGAGRARFRLGHALEACAVGGGAVKRYPALWCADLQAGGVAIRVVVHMHGCVHGQLG